VVAVMHANNELGTLNPIDAFGAQVQACGATFVVDAVQTFPWYWPGDIETRPYDVVTLAAHKFGGPPGVGVLYIRGGVNVEPLVRGGGQERELRAGTENVLGIVGAAAALREARTDSSREGLAAIRDAFVAELGPRWIPTVQKAETLPGHAHGRFPGVSADSMLIRLDGLGISASSGAACSSGSIEPSHVMMACGYSETEALEALRFSLGSGISRAQAQEAARRIRSAADAIYALRGPTG
jgi:cysteine desulfurase